MAGSNRWRSLASIFGYRRNYQSELRLKESYGRVLKDGGASREDMEVVLADLMNKSGYARVSPPDTPDAELRHKEGMRHLMGLILANLDLDADSFDQLRTAARHEALADQQAENH